LAYHLSAQQRWLRAEIALASSSPGKKPGVKPKGTKCKKSMTFEALRADREPETIAKFLELETGWTMLRDSDWYAYYNDEKPIGPFATEAEAARAGLQAWGKETAPGG
jgi:hypothetical protein